jgi:ribosome recycling factor
MRESFREIELKMKHASEHLHAEFKTLRTGRANTALLDGVTVNYYGNPTPLNQIANVTVGDAHLLIIQPYDPGQIHEIEKGIHASGLGLNPSNDGRLVRVPLPTLTEERRKELVKKAHDMAEHCRTAVRQARREGNDQLKKMEKEKKISQDDEKRGHDEIQKLHDHYIAEIAKALQSKEKDILAV